MIYNFLRRVTGASQFFLSFRLSLVLLFSNCVCLALCKTCYILWKVLNFTADVKFVRLIEMAKSATITIKLESTEKTGFFYVAKKNPRKRPEKLEFKKYDPVVRKHVLFKETKIK